jgi:peptide/nickel transport system permease protein
MQQYLIQRLLLALPVILGVTLIVFTILHLTPGDPVRIMAGPRASEAQVQTIRNQLGLDRSIPEQYMHWLGHVIQGDLGTSIAGKRPVAELIGERLPFTLRLTVLSLVISVVVGIPLGILAAVKHHRAVDHLITFGALFSFSIPSFWLGLMLILLFGLWLRWTPISGAQGMASLALPAATLALPQIGILARLMRTEMLEVLQADYIKTARAKGLHPLSVTYGHALRNALIPVTVLIFLSLPWLIGGAVVVETIFAWPGMGRLMVQALIQKDFPVIQGLLLIIALSTILANLLGDIVTAMLDPRIQSS